ncbi:MAG: sensor histidine kinase [Eubacteriales bacterium]
MIKRLRIKFIAVTMGVLVLVFVIVFATLNIYMRTSSSAMTRQLLQMVAVEDGFTFPGIPDRQPPAKTLDITQYDPPSYERRDIFRAGRFFYVKLTRDGDVLETNHEMMFDFTQQQAEAYAQTVFKKMNDSGSIDNLQYLKAEKDYGYIVVFAEKSIELQMLSRLMNISFWVAGGTFAVLLVLSVFMSGWVVKPVELTFDKQRRFVSDASHELKTPLTIINASADVLENEIGNNPRIGQIKTQAERMNLLIRDLLALARTDEGTVGTVMSGFNLSRAVLSTALEFESRAFEEGRNYSYEVQENIIYSGDEKKIKQLLSILIDNAIVHSGMDDTVTVSLGRESGRICLSVYNTGMGIEESLRGKVFDRFYRGDSSRSRETGGYGLGLSIAKSIADIHKAKISVTGRTGEWVMFSVIM